MTPAYGLVVMRVAGHNPGRICRIGSDVKWTTGQRWGMLGLCLTILAATTIDLADPAPPAVVGMYHNCRGLAGVNREQMIARAIP